MLRLLEGVVIFFAVAWILAVFLWKITFFAIHLLVVFAIIALVLRLFGVKA